MGSRGLQLIIRKGTYAGRLPAVSMGLYSSVYAVSDSVVIGRPLLMRLYKRHVTTECRIYTRIGQTSCVHITKPLRIYQSLPGPRPPPVPSPEVPVESSRPRRVDLTVGTS